MWYVFASNLHTKKRLNWHQWLWVATKRDEIVVVEATECEKLMWKVNESYQVLTNWCSLNKFKIKNWELVENSITISENWIIIWLKNVAIK